MATDWQSSPKRVGPGRMLFAVGDIHGHSQQLLALRELIQGEISRHSKLRSKIIYLGDYIDRGPDSRGVLQFLADERQRQTVDSAYLYGNHDSMLKILLDMEPDDDPALHQENLELWLINGGMPALHSFGIFADGEEGLPADLDSLRERIRSNLGDAILGFLDELGLFHREDDYLFVHAGVSPYVEFEHCSIDDMLWIRNAFLDAGAYWKHPFCVVHGHTPSCPEILDHRIGVDTGVYMSGALSAVQLVDDKVRFLTVAEVPDTSWQNRIYGGRPVFYSLLPA
jgi:serine/threonine protein phosphatase 1